MRGVSHGDWNRFLCSQILGAERDTVLPGGRHPSVSSSNPTKTTPGGMLPGGVAVAVAASPGGLRTPGWNPAWRLLAPSARGPAARSRPGGSGGLLLALGARRPTARSKPSGNASAWGVRRSRWPKGAPLSPQDVRRSQRGRRSGPAGAGRLAVACTSVFKLSLSNGFGADAGGLELWLDHCW